MDSYASNYGSSKFGMGKKSTFCAQFVHRTINAGGGGLEPVFRKAIMPHIFDMQKLYQKTKSLTKVMNSFQMLPVPKFEVMRIRKQFPELNQGYKSLNTN